ncbi:hypothetical protein D9M72_486500 [compost metagenome]
MFFESFRQAAARVASSGIDWPCTTSSSRVPSSSSASTKARTTEALNLPRSIARTGSAAANDLRAMLRSSSWKMNARSIEKVSASSAFGFCFFRMPLLTRCAKVRSTSAVSSFERWASSLEDKGCWGAA